MDVTVFVPGLFTAFDEFTPQDIDSLQCNAWRRILSRAIKQPEDSTASDHWLYRQFNSNHEEATSVPVAALTAMLDGIDSREGYWVRADPVYLYPDTHSLILQDPSTLKLDNSEVALIRDLTAPLFDDYGAQLFTPHPNRWYLKFDQQTPDIRCTPLVDALFHPINSFLPQGEDKRRWHTLFNEIQMLLNQSPVNQEREKGRKQPVNSMWFWGEGCYPIDLQSVYHLCVGNDELLTGLCKATDTAYLPEIDSTPFTLSGNVLLVDQRLRQAVQANRPDNWLDALLDTNTKIIAPLIEQLSLGECNRVILHDANHTYQCQRKQLRAFWRPIRKLSACLLA